MFLYINKRNKNIIKNILFFALILLLGTFVLFSGCVSFCSPNADTNKECISYSDAVNMCLEVSTPPQNYPICSDFSKNVPINKLNTSKCDSKFSSRISGLVHYKNLSLNTEQFANNFRQSILSSWKNADVLAYAYTKVNNTCNSIFNTDLISYEQKIKTTATNLDFHNKETVYYLLGTLNSFKKDLIDMNIDLMQDTKLYQDYIKVNNIFNEFQKSFGKKVKVKESLAKDSIDFYSKYYATSASKETLSKAISELATNIDQTETNIDYFSWSVGLSGVLMVSATDPALATFIPLIISGFNKSKSIATQVSDVLDTAAEKTNLNEWKRMDVLKNMLSGFIKAHGANSSSDKSVFELLSNADSHISDIIKEDSSKEKDLLTDISKLKTELNEKIQEKEKYQFLYTKYSVVESPYDYQTKLQNIYNNVKALDLLTIGEKHHNLIILKSQYDSLKQDIQTYLDSDYKSLVSLCTADILSLKSKVNDLPDSQNKTLIQSYITLFLNAKEDYKKVIYCSKFFKNYSDENYNCKSELNNLSKNLDLGIKNFDMTELECEQQVNTQLANAKNTKKYKDLQAIYSKLLNEKQTLEKLSNFSSCFSSKLYIESINTINSYNQNSKYTKDVILSLLLSDNFLDKETQMASFYDSLKKKITSGINCVLQSNYELNLDKNKLIINNYFGNINSNFEVTIPNYNVVNIEKKECLKNVDVSKSKLTLQFNCLKNNMEYNLILKGDASKQEILSLAADSFSGVLKTKECVSSLTKPKYTFQTPVSHNKITSFFADNGFNPLPIELNNNKVTVLFSNLTNSEACANITYKLIKPINLDANIFNIKYKDKYAYITYLVTLRNNLFVSLPILKVTLKNSNINESISSKDVKITTDPSLGLSYITLKDVAPLETKTFYYTVKINNLKENFVSDLNEIYNNILILQTYSFINKSTISDLLNEYKNTKAIKDDKTKAKAIEELKKKVNSLLSDAKDNSLYVNRYSKALQKLENAIAQYNSTATIIYQDYNYKVPPLDIEALNSKISDAKELYDSGEVKKAVRILESLKVSTKPLGDYLLQIYKEKAQKTKNIKNELKKLGLDSQKVSDSLSKTGFNFTQEVGAGQFTDALNTLKEYDSKQDEFVTNLNRGKEDIKKSILNTLKKYSNYKKNLDSLWLTYSNLDSELNSSHFNAIKKFGITFNFTSSNLTALKNKLNKITKDIINLDKFQKYSSPDATIDLLDFDFDSFNKFFTDINSISDSFKMYYKEMKSKANSEVVLAASNLGANLNKEFYKSKDSYDANKFVDAIYFARISQLDTSDSSKTDYTLYIGLGFIALLIVLVLVFGNRFIPKTKEKPKETYYTVDREN